MTTLKTENRIRYFDLMRVAACVFVILLHAAAQQIDAVELGSRAWLVFNVYESLCHWAVPVFVMISGALFLDPNRPFDLRGMLKKNLLRLITAFVFWSALYAGVEYLHGVRLRTVVYHFVIGSTHLWFLYMLAGLYLIVPLLRKLTESEKLTKYFLLLWAFVSVGLCSFALVIQFFDSRFVDWLDVVADRIQLRFAAGYAGYFVLGHFLHQTDLSKKKRTAVYALGILGTVAVILYLYLFLKRDNVRAYSYFDNFAPGVALQAIAVFVFCKYHPPKGKSIAAQKLLLTLSTCSFGIYLVHFLFVIHSAEIFRFHSLSLDPIVSVPLLTIVVFVVSLLISYILNHIPVVKKYLV